ncbi:SCO family protein [Gilvibacter sediminis]|uniref:SCO family protein n=1 Tax=Gilvibacter sediminis TaxID=379071 RepID=UPI00234FEE5F|nr:SCO family protein [Gilvibacter sediminis]MDC7996401.1 SCO family protein [Gilvibacter sediminis]
MNKSYSYIGISFIILIFGIWAVPKIVGSVNQQELATIGPVPQFEFTNQRGETITNANYEGKVYVVDFFFTTCPTICPIMSRNMVKLQDEFFGNPNFGVASFSIDPTYDTPEVLQSYAESYGITNPNWHLMTGDKLEIHKLANNGFNLYVNQDDTAEGGFEHSGFFALIDQEGNIRSRIDEYGNPIVYYNGTDLEQIQLLKDDIKQLLDQ